MLVGLIVFPIVFVITLLCVGLGLAFHESQRKARVRQMLWTAENNAPMRATELVREADQQSELLNSLSQLPAAQRLSLFLHQSLSGWSLPHFLFLTLVCAVIGGLIGWKLSLFGSTTVSTVLLLAGAGTLPLLLVLQKRGKAMKAFETQFPEALDFLSRSMRAGHGFSISLELLAKDASEPLGGALRRVCHEMQMGAPIQVAMQKMLVQFPLVDVRFFVSAILLQQETGGNLSEILNKLSSVVRERFRLRGQVRALSAHGRVTGMVLLFMPVAVFLASLAISPEYMGAMIADKDGRMMLYGAVAGQVIAYFVIKKIVNIKV